MADTVETPAESSPAGTKPAELSIPTDPAAYAEWRQTGKLPGDDKPSKREVSATSKPSGDEESETTAPASEAGKLVTGRNAETRIKQLASERDTFRTERDQYRAKLEALEAGKTDAHAASSPAPAKDAKAATSTAPDASGVPVEPNQDDFDSWDEYEKAKKVHFNALVKWEVQQALRATDEQRQNDARLAEAEQRYGPEAKPKILEAAHVLWTDNGVAPAVKAAIKRSKVMVDSLYVLNSDKAEFAEFLQLSKEDPLEAVRKWFTIEALVQQELGKAGKAGETGEAPARGPDGKFLPVKKSAPAPPLELNGNAVPAGDQSERAASAGNFSAFKADRDRKDVLRFKGQ